MPQEETTGSARNVSIKFTHIVIVGGSSDVAKHVIAKYFEAVLMKAVKDTSLNAQER